MKPLFTSTEEREQTIARIDQFRVHRPSSYDMPAYYEKEHPVGHLYDKGEECQRPKREKAREMPQWELCRKLFVLMATTTVALIMAVGSLSASEKAMPILSMHTDRIGAFDVLTTVRILPHADNTAVCVALAGPDYHARWGCAFVPEPTTREVTIHWTDVKHGEYAIEAGLMQSHRPPNVGQKVVLTYRRAFGVVTL